MRGKGSRCERLTTLPPSCADCHEIWEPQTPGTLRACPGLYRDCSPFHQNSIPTPHSFTINAKIQTASDSVIIS